MAESAMDRLYKQLLRRWMSTEYKPQFDITKSEPTWPDVPRMGDLQPITDTSIERLIDLSKISPDFEKKIPPRIEGVVGTHGIRSLETSSDKKFIELLMEMSAWPWAAKDLPHWTNPEPPKKRWYGISDVQMQGWEDDVAQAKADLRDHIKSQGADEEAMVQWDASMDTTNDELFYYDEEWNRVLDEEAFKKRYGIYSDEINIRGDPNYVAPSKLKAARHWTRFGGSSMPWGSIVAPFLGAAAAAAASPLALAAEQAFDFAISPTDIPREGSQPRSTYMSQQEMDWEDLDLQPYVDKYGTGPDIWANPLGRSTTSQRAIDELIRRAQAGTPVNRYRR